MGISAAWAGVAWLAVAPGIAPIEGFVSPADGVEPAPGTPITDPAMPRTYSGVGHEPDTVAAFDSPTVLFVNFDGPFLNGGCGNDSTNDCSQLFPNTQFAPFPGDDQKKAAVIQATREDVEDFGVIVVAERPPAGNPYAMVVVGLPNGNSTGQIGGVAPGINCGNTNPNITSFAFLVNSTSNTIATVIHQEAAHTWGLEHVDDNTDNLYPTAGGTTDPKYQDRCSRVVANTDLDPTSASCNQVHTMFCDTNFQNSYQEMLALFGGPVVDAIPPLVTIDAPANGATFAYDDDFELVITLDDDRRPQIIDTTIFFDGQEAAMATLLDDTHGFPVSGGDAPSGHGLANGEHTIEVVVADESGNEASASVTIVIEGAPGGGSGDADGSGAGSSGDDSGGGTSGGGSSAGSGGGDGSESSDTDGTGAAAGDDGGCGCRTEPGPAPWTWALLALPVLVGRRRGLSRPPR